MAKGVYIEMAHHPQAILDTLTKAEKDARDAKQQWGLGCGFAVAVIVIGALAYFLGSQLDYGQILVLLALVLWGVAVVAGIALLINRPRFPRQQFEPVRQVIHTLRDDTGRKGRVVGWLDMTGPQQKSKQTRTARSGGGKQKVYYNDPWLQAKFKLVDGNVLRLALIDKVKTKAGSTVKHRTQFKAKLVVNPDLYRVNATPVDGSTAPIHVYSEGQGTLSINAEVDPQRLPVEHILKSLKAMYAYLEPIRQIRRISI